MSLVKLRPATADDLSLIYATWFENYKHSSPTGRRLRPDVYYPGQRAIIDRLLKRDGTITIASPNEDDTILGYIVFEGPCIHYCYVKASFRRMGIGKELITSQPFQTFSHWTDDAEWAHKKFNLVYNPYEAYA